jgi:ATP-dependent Lon protease
VGVADPVMLLDEVDKLGRDAVRMDIALATWLGFWWYAEA